MVVVGFADMAGGGIGAVVEDCSLRGADVD
jgi:hypothetical protein